MKTYWHDVNPWRDRIVYVPIERLAEAIEGGKVSTGNGIEDHNAAWILRHWRAYGDQLDAYILPQPDRVHSVGVRYGAEGSQYLSPHNEHPERVRALLAEFSAGDDA